MRVTGKFYWYTLASALIIVLSHALMALWDDSTTPFHLWVDMIPGGLGLTSVTTTTLIVSPRMSDRQSSY